MREARDGTRPSGNGNRQKNGFCILEGMVWQGPVVFNAGSKSLQTFPGVGVIIVILGFERSKTCPAVRLGVIIIGLSG